MTADTGGNPPEDEFGTLARVRRGVGREPPRALHPGVPCRRSGRLLRNLRRCQRVVGPTSCTDRGPHRWRLDEQPTGQPTARLSELRLPTTDVQESEPWQGAALPATAVRQRSVVLTKGSSKRCRRCRRSPMRSALPRPGTHDTGTADTRARRRRRGPCRLRNRDRRGTFRTASVPRAGDRTCTVHGSRSSSAPPRSIGLHPSLPRKIIANGVN